MFLICGFQFKKTVYENNIRLWISSENLIRSRLKGGSYSRVIVISVVFNCYIFSMADTDKDIPVIPLLIAGKKTASEPSVRFPVYSYNQQKDVYLAESANPATASAAADAAAETFKTWKKVPAVERRELLQRYANLLRKHADELVSVQKAETSAPELWARKNIELAVGLIEETAACVTSLKGDIPPTESPSILSLAFTVPVGPVLVIAPYVSLVISKILPHWMCD